MGFGPMAARGDAAAPQRLTMEDWMSRSAVFRQQNPQLAPRVTAATTQPTTAATTPAQTPYYGGSDVENQSTGGKAFSEMTNQELRDYSDRRNNGNIFERNLEYAVPGLQMLGIPGFAMRGLEKSQLASELEKRGFAGAGVAAEGFGGQTAGGTTSSGVEGDRGFLYKGGPTKGRLIGPDPEGPDDGYAGLDENEYVIRAKATQKYGNDLLDKINAGSLSKKSLAKALMGRRR